MDPIAQMLTKIRNAQLAGHDSVNIMASKLKLAIAKILEKEGYVQEVAMESENNKEFIKIVLKYDRVSKTERRPAITGIRRVSKEGQRIYVKSKDISRVKNNYGIGIVTTSQGVMTNYESKKKGLGGEYVCEVW